jgi:hypothetical protein
LAPSKVAARPLAYDHFVFHRALKQVIDKYEEILLLSESLATMRPPTEGLAGRAMGRYALIAIIGILALISVPGVSDMISLRELAGFKNSMRALISLVLLGTSLIVIITERYSEKDKNWAYGTVGALVGFWLHEAT